MSYCRFSCLHGYSDAYVYEDVHGGWTTHLAGCRRPAGAPADDMSILLAAGQTKDHPAMALWMAQHKMHLDWCNDAEPKPIDHPEAGKRFNHETPGECADNLKRLRSEGFIIPQYAIESLREEQKEMEASDG